MTMTQVFLTVVVLVAAMTVYGIAVDHTAMFEGGMMFLFFCIIPIIVLFVRERIGR